jgi:DNA-binding transcriptional ArsR family regulator
MTTSTLPSPSIDTTGECEVRLMHPDAVARVEAALPSAAEVEAATERLKLLADPTRFRVLSALAREELCVCDLAAVAGVNESSMSHQLRLLRAHGLVAFRKDGRMAYYRLANDAVRPLLSPSLLKG